MPKIQERTKTIKKFLAAFLCAAMALSLSACSDNNETPDNSKDNSVSDSKKDNNNSKDESKDNSSEGGNNSEENSSTDGSDSYVESKPEDSTPEQPAANEDDFSWYYNNEGVTIDYYMGSDENVVIPSTLGGRPVTKIVVDGLIENGFKKNIDIVSLTIPATVEYIGDRAFESCINLKEVTFLGDTPDFTLSSFLGTPWYEENLKADADTGLIIVGNALVQAYNESAPKDIVVPDGIKRINRYAFRYGELTSITIPDSVSEIGEHAFDRCGSLENVMLPAGITEIKENTFFFCESLKSIDIPTGVIGIGVGAFYGCSTNINLPDTMTWLNDFGDGGILGVHRFNGTVTFKGNKYTYSEFEELKTAVRQNAIEIEFGGKDYIIEGSVLVKVNPNLEKGELPDSITDIADDAFDDCNGNIIITYKGKNYNYANIYKLKEDVKGS